MKIAILGYDVEGRASYDYFAAQGHQVSIRDRDPGLDVPADADSILGKNYLDNLSGFDLLVRTPGLPPRLILDKNPGVKAKITTQLNEFLRVCPTRNIIGVTGTKGKGTTSTLITKMLEATGLSVYLGGNIGLAALTMLDELTADSWVVLELSSFQLIDLKEQAPRIAVCLMMAPEHLNWHADLAEYVEAKSQLFAKQSADDIAIYFAQNDLSKQVASRSPGHKIPYYAPPGATVEDGQITIAGQAICATNELRLIGQHNWQNACAAITAVWQVTQDVEALRGVLTTFTSLEHRIEFVRELDGVKYYNDSYGTTPETAITAINAFEAPKVIILGGSDKGANYDELASTIANANLRKVLLIGEQAARIKAALDKAGFTNITDGGKTIEDIAATARHEARRGDVVLLSPACASFDMFDNYKQRGEKFKQAVRALA
jgi:UDP-N-acetylmuramoylalanine--D-glutamate ligase